MASHPLRARKGLTMTLRRLQQGKPNTKPHMWGDNFYNQYVIFSCGLLVVVLGGCSGSPATAESWKRQASMVADVEDISISFHFQLISCVYVYNFIV